MHSVGRHAWYLWLLGGLLTLPLAAEEPSPLPVLYGVMGREATKRAWLGPTLGESRWHAEGARVGAYVLQTIAVEKGLVTVLGPDQAVVEITLSGVGGQYQLGPILIAAEDLDWAWIRSDENPMRDKPETLSDGMITDWVQGNPSSRVAIRNHYRRMGWDVVFIEVKDDGRIHASIAPLRNPLEPQPTREEIRARQAGAGSILPEG